MAPRRIVILRPGAIGDTLLTLPALRALRARFPEAEVLAVGNRPALGLARAAGLVDRVDAFGADWVSDLFGDEPTPALRERLGGLDLGIVWMHDAAAADLAARLEAAGVRQARPAVSFPAPGSGRHLADHLVDTLAPLGIAGPRPEVRLYPNLEGVAGEWERADTQVRPYGGGQAPPDQAELGDRGSLVVLHPGAGGRRKRWPAERFAALADGLARAGHRVAITAGPADEEAVAAMRAALRVAEPRLLRGLELGELAAVLARARLFVGNDSGITHLAGLLGVPTLAIFGPYDPAYWAPLGPRGAVLDAGAACPHRADPREGCHRCDLLPSLALETVSSAARALLSAG